MSHGTNVVITCMFRANPIFSMDYIVSNMERTNCTCLRRLPNQITLVCVSLVCIVLFSFLFLLYCFGFLYSSSFPHQIYISVGFVVFFFPPAEMLFLLWGVRLCIVVRKAPSEFNESRFISWAIYNEFLLSLFLNVSMWVVWLSYTSYGLVSQNGQYRGHFFSF